jgi:heme/copper-type cytochrome/quinol oxidase subunit 2
VFIAIEGVEYAGKLAAGLSSKDVVHSFALPQMRIKQDAIPGVAQPVWFTRPRRANGR